MTWQRTPAGITVHARCRQFTGDCSFSFQARLPPGVATSASVGSGSLTAAGLAGQVQLEGHSGDIHLSGLTGGAVISDQSGTITGDSLSGPQVVIHNASGDITVSGLPAGT